LRRTGEVLIGETLSRLVRKMDGLIFVDRGRSEFRGYSDPVRIMQVVREDAAAGEASTAPGGADTGSEARA
jgi:class 3 adenylate cyclase